MDKELINDIIDSLSTMIDYADDGVISRETSGYEHFFKDIDKARALLDELNDMVNEPIEKYEEPTPWDLEFERGFKGSNEY